MNKGEQNCLIEVLWPRTQGYSFIPINLVWPALPGHHGWPLDTVQNCHRPSGGSHDLPHTEPIFPHWRPKRAHSQNGRHSWPSILSLALTCPGPTTTTHTSHAPHKTWGLPILWLPKYPRSRADHCSIILYGQPNIELVPVDVLEWSHLFLVYFLQALETCFALMFYDDPKDALFKLTQKGSIN